MQKTLLFILFFVMCFFSPAQNFVKVIDSIKKEILTIRHDSIKIKAYGDLCWYYRSVSKDSAFKYGNLALKLSVLTQDLKGEAQAYNDMGILYYDLSEYPKSLQFYKKSLKIRDVLNDTLGKAAIYNKMGLVYQNTFKMDSAIFYGSKALKIYEENKNFKYVALIKNNIANIYKGLKQYKRALNTHLEISELNKKMKNERGLIRSYNNIANSYFLLNNIDRSFYYYKEGIRLAVLNNYEEELPALYKNYAGVLQSRGEFDEAVNYVEKSLDLRQKLNNNQGIASSTLHLAGLYLEMGNLNKARDYLKEGFRLSRKIGAGELQLDAYDKFSSYFIYRREVDSALKYRSLFKVLKDSLLSERVTKEVTEIQEKYDKAERDKKIASQRANIAEKELNINQKNTQIIGLVLLAAVISILAYLLYNQQKLKNTQLKKEGELKEALVKIETQNSLQDQRLRISRDLHDNIGAQLTFIISSIENLQYGFKIKNEKLTNKLTGISDFTKDTIYELRDTIWAMNKNCITIDDLQARISNFIDKANLALKDTTFIFKVDDTIPNDIEFTSVKGMNIYRVIQEACNNAIKYANASKIDVLFNSVGDRILVSIIDDGVGFEEDKVELGSGLSNMRKRITDIEGEIEINSKPKEGTKISITV